MWTKENSQGFESRKCRDRNLKYLQGKTIFDLGCGNEKVVPGAIGIDLVGMAADLKLDLSEARSMYMFNEGIADTVFSSHTLEHFSDTEGILKSWWRLVKPNGHLILYLPHKDLYPSDGNPDHKHEFTQDDIIRLLDSFASYKLITNEVHSEDNEYSFEIVAQKIASPEQVIIKDLSTVGVKTAVTPEVDEFGGDMGLLCENCFDDIQACDKCGKPFQSDDIITCIEDTSHFCSGKCAEHSVKRCLIIRYGASGDMVTITPLLKQLKQDGYEVHLVCTPRTVAIENNPNIDYIYTQERGIISGQQLVDYHNTISKRFDKVINLCGSIEGALLFEYGAQKEYFYTKEDRHKVANVNYYDRTMEMGGYPDIKGVKGEMFISDCEQSLIKVLQKRHEGFFKILWQVRGSSEHKIYPYMQDIVDELVEKYNDIRVFVVGGPETQVLDWVHPNIRNCIGKWNEREALIMTSAVDLVISPESGILNAAGCFDTPKIGLLTHSSKENLTKYFINDYSIEADCECAPCHRLVHRRAECKLGGEFMLPVCMERGIPPEKVKAQILELYEKWKQGK